VSERTLDKTFSRNKIKNVETELKLGRKRTPIFGVASILTPCIGTIFIICDYNSEHANGPLYSDRGLGYAMSLFGQLSFSFICETFLALIALVRCEKHWSLVFAVLFVALICSVFVFFYCN
jgi:hypothetical protein